MSQTLYVATFTLLDGTSISVPIGQISGYAEQYAFQENPTPPPSHIATRQSTTLFLTDNREIPVSETAAQVNAAIYAAINIGPP